LISVGETALRLFDLTTFLVRTIKLRATFVHVAARLGDEILQREVAQAIVALNESFLRRFEARSVVVAQFCAG
jgi:hypothetical protein